MVVVLLVAIIPVLIQQLITVVLIVLLTVQVIAQINVKDYVEVRAARPPAEDLVMKNALVVLIAVKILHLALVVDVLPTVRVFVVKHASLCAITFHGDN